MEKKKGQLHQLLAVLPNLKSAAERAKATAGKAFASSHLFQGFTKAYQPKNEEEEYLADSLAETKPLPGTVGKTLADFAAGIVPHIDAELQRDRTNCLAAADLNIGDRIFTGVPATFLLQLKKGLAEIKKVYEGIPTLDPKIKWETAPDQGEGVFISPVTVTMRTKKTNVHKVVQEPTEHHPAQVAAWTEDVPVGKFEIRHWSGMVSPATKAKALAKIEALSNAVTKALAVANQVEHDHDKIAEAIFGVINEGL